MTIAERIAQSTWERLKHSRDYRVRLGEETLTDILILDLARWNASGRFCLHQPTKHDESKEGADLEIWIRVGWNSAVHLVIQAKKLGSAGRYDHLNPRASRGNDRQIDRLDHHARDVNAIPLYLFYNDVDNAEASSCWHCCQQTCDERQTGCTLVPSWCVRAALSQRGSRTFCGVHRCSDPPMRLNRTESALPWRCFFDCSNGIESILERLQVSYELYSPPEFNIEDNGRYGWLQFVPKENAWPNWLWSRDDTALLSQRELSQLYRMESANWTVDSQKTPIGLEEHPMPQRIPKRILLADPGIENPADPSEHAVSRQT